MKIAFIATGGFDRGGRERVVPALLWLVERLARRHEVHVFVLDYYDQPCTYPLAGATVHDLGRVTAPRGLRRLRIGRRLARALAREGPFDLLHAYWGVPAGVLAVTCARRMGIPAIVTLDSGELVAIEDIGYGLQRRLLDRRAVDTAIAGATAVTVCTEYMLRLLDARLKPRAPTWHVVPIGADQSRFTQVERPPGPPWRLIRVASINHVKDYATLLRALKTMVARGEDVHLDIVGEDTLNGAIHALCETLGLSRHVTFHGFQPSDRLDALYAAAHLNVVSSRHEAANVSMLEAACTGLATVGTATGYVADWAPQRAVAVPIGDADALAAAIVGLLNDRPARERIAAAAREWALAHDANWTAQEFERLYAHVVSRR